jgi:hypothetical protein
MEEKELILKIKELKNIKPNRDWVVSTKATILGDELKTNWVSILEFFPGLIYRHSKLAFASLAAFGLVVGTLGFAQGALPGDPIYTLKRVTEKAQMAFVKEGNLPYAQLALAQKRLAELNTIAQTNQVKKIAPAVQEFQASISRAAKDLAKNEKIDIAKTALEAKKIEESRQKIESLGVVIGDTKDYDDALAKLVDREIKDLEQRVALREQREVLFKAKVDFAEGRYSQALERILLLKNNPENQ